MYRKCATEISVRHQKQVEQSLLELMRKLPFEDISVTQLCREANISRRVFYHLFTNKTDALYALIDHSILDAESYCPEIPDQAVRFFRYWKAHQALLDALLENQLTGLLLERMLWTVLNEDYDVRHWIRTEAMENGREILVFVVSGIMGMVHHWHLGGYKKSPEEMASLVVQMLQPSGEKQA